MLELFFADFIRLFQENPWAQTMSLLGMAITLYGFMQTDDNKVKKILFISVFAWIGHHLLMWLYIAAVASLISLLRIILSMKYHKNIYAFYFIMTLSIVFWVLTYESFIHTIPILTGIIWTIAFTFFHGFILRILSLLWSALWLWFAISVGSIGWMINEVFVQFVLLITIIRMLGHEWHLHHYREVIHNLLHKHHDIDFGHMIVFKDIQKIIHHDWYLKKSKDYVVQKSKNFRTIVKNSFQKAANTFHKVKN